MRNLRVLGETDGARDVRGNGGWCVVHRDLDCGAVEFNGRAPKLRYSLQGLKVFNTYLTLDFDSAKPVLDPRLKDLVARLKARDTALWLAITNVSREPAVEIEEEKRKCLLWLRLKTKTIIQRNW